ncbi:MAG: hypothetical protein ABIE94_06200 [archaeon]
MVDFQKVMCKRCKRIVPMSDARYTNPTTLVCLNCFNKENPTRAVQPELRKPGPSAIIDGEPIGPIEFINYECVNCGYNFSMKSETAMARRCPYCSSEKVQVAKRPGQEVDELIDDSMSQEFDR